MSDLKDILKQEEGFRSKPYRDHLGFLTIGYGTLLEHGISKEEAEALLDIRIDSTYKKLRDSSKGNLLLTLDNKSKDAITEMAYQLGVHGCLNFKKMWAAIEIRDFQTAAKEILDSRWFIQTPRRCKRIAEIIRRTPV